MSWSFRFLPTQAIAWFFDSIIFSAKGITRTDSFRVAHQALNTGVETDYIKALSFLPPHHPAALQQIPNNWLWPLGRAELSNSYARYFQGLVWFLHTPQTMWFVSRKKTCSTAGLQHNEAKIFATSLVTPPWTQWFLARKLKILMWQQTSFCGLLPKLRGL